RKYRSAEAAKKAEAKRKTEVSSGSVNIRLQCMNQGEQYAQKIITHNIISYFCRMFAVLPPCLYFFRRKISP
ncbi:MAG: hypothetical protein KAQ78_05980, partial [Candidatus Latescibacteria bacterium]|nr:hypothetical protein [Candidatus Latescibacterota bacterium]